MALFHIKKSSPLSLKVFSRTVLRRLTATQTTITPIRITMTVAIPGTKIFACSHSGHQSGSQRILPSAGVGGIVAVNELQLKHINWANCCCFDQAKSLFETYQIYFQRESIKIGNIKLQKNYIVA